MLNFLDGIRGITLADVIIKLTVTLLLGSIIGVERSYKNRPAGFRTHILVSIGSAVASICGLYLCISTELPADVSRIGAAVVSGLGFLGAGTIIVTKNYTVKGLTTAAGLWTSGIIGLAVGAGFYEGAVVTTVFVLLAETALGGLVSKIKRDPEFQIQVLFSDKKALDQVIRCCKNNKMAITNLRVISAMHNNEACYRAYVLLHPRMKVDKTRLYREIELIDGITEYSEVDMTEHT